MRDESYLEPEPTVRELIRQRLAKLKISISDDIPYRLESVFAQTTGWGGNGEIKRRAKLLVKVEPKLGEILLPKEEVLYVAKGVQHSFLESYLMGVWANLLNQTVQQHIFGDLMKIGVAFQVSIFTK